MRRIRKEAAMT